MRTPEIATVDDLVRVLDEHPQWLEALRERLLTRELLALPQQFADLTQQVADLTQQVADLTQQVADLTQQAADLTQQAADFAATTDRRFEAADKRSAALAQQLADLTQQVADFAATTDRRFEAADKRSAELERNLADLRAATNRQFDQLRIDLGPIKAAYAANAARTAADLMAEMQGLKFVDFVGEQELWAMTRGSGAGKISREELLSFRYADIVIRATDPAGTECYVAVEVSYTANGRDTKRAQRNARFLTRFTGRRADAMVASLRIDDRIRAAVDSGEVAWYQLIRQVFEVE